MTRLPSFCLGVFLFLVLAGCTFPQRAPTSASPLPSATVGQPVATGTVLPEVTTAAAPPLGLESVQAACSVDAQQRPFRDDLTLTLETLDIPLCYDLDFTLNERGDAFEAHAQIALRNDSEDRWPDLLFRLYPHAPLLFGGKLIVTEVLVNGAPVAFERILADETGLRVLLAESLLPDEQAVVAISFSGDLATDAGQQERVYGIFARTEHAATLASWFPLLAVWDEGTDQWFDVPVLGEGDAVFAESGLIRARLTAPEHFALATSGLIVGTEANEGRVTYEVVSGPARDLTMVWMEGYEQSEATVEGTLIRNWYRPGDEGSAARVLEAARESLGIFNERFGPYPFEEIEIVEVPLYGAGGVEYPQLFLMAQELYGPRGDQQFLVFATAHEMAHQWWYSAVGNDINAAPWLDEALTNWSALLWLEESAGEQVAEQVARGFEGSVRQYEAAEGEGRIAAPLDAFRGRSAAYATIVYLKGTLFFAALREEIGDEAFFGALQAYYTTHRFGIAQPADLLGRFEARSGRSLDDFYLEWGVE